MERTQRLADAQADRTDMELVDGVLVRAAPPLEDAERLAHLASGLKGAEEHNGIAEIADVHRGGGTLAEEAVPY
ncbi:MAG TPA: hypothetical protein VL242_42340, partial [Sorangium sp.]|nr:hypothetical protein [Sorangium sp.]